MVSIISCLSVWSHIYTHTPTHKEKRNREIDDTCLLQLARGDKVKCVCVCHGWHDWCVWSGSPTIAGSRWPLVGHTELLKATGYLELSAWFSCMRRVQQWMW